MGGYRFQGPRVAAGLTFQNARAAYWNEVNLAKWQDACWSDRSMLLENHVFSLQTAHTPRDLARYRAACGQIDGRVLLTPAETKINVAPALAPAEDIGRQTCRPLAAAPGSRSNGVCSDFGDKHFSITYLGLSGRILFSKDARNGQPIPITLRQQ